MNLKRLQFTYCRKTLLVKVGKLHDLEDEYNKNDGESKAKLSDSYTEIFRSLATFFHSPVTFPSSTVIARS